MVQLHSYVETKKEISNEIFDNILGKMSNLEIRNNENE